jgi:hypothetical protein
MNSTTLSYVSLGSNCYTALSLIPNKIESLPFDSIDNFCDLQSIYEILNELINDKFDVSEFIKLDDNSYNK